MINTIYIGYDPREKVAYDVAEYSIRARACRSVDIRPLKLDEVRNAGILTRPIEKKDGRLYCPISQAPMATEFAISRFCVPFIHKPELHDIEFSRVDGSKFRQPFTTDAWALFVDCDVLLLADVNDLFALADDKYAVLVVKHNCDQYGYVEGWLKCGCKIKFIKESVAGASVIKCEKHGPQAVEKTGKAVFPDEIKKMDNQLQTFYSRKNWSSVVLWNVTHPANQHLTLEALNTWPGRDLHAFKWLKDDEIGELPLEWNYLVGVSPKIERPKLVHMTLGTPNIPGYENCEFADEWRREFGKMTCNES